VVEIQSNQKEKGSMKQFKGTLALLIALASGSAAQAVNQVWFTAPGSASEGPGQPLVLNGPGNWTVTMMLSVDADTAIAGWANDFTGTAGLAVTGFNYSATPFTFPNGGETFGPAPNLLIGAGNATFGTPAGQGTYTLMTFNLGSSTNSGSVSTTVGPFEWAGAAGYPSVQFGDNNPVIATGGTVIPNAVIQIVPEPATLGLLCVGLVSLLRRRRLA
jgi:hypothetical protein